MIVGPYRNIKQFTRILVEPYHMNSDIENHMKMILKKKDEKKCNKNGYIDEVYRIIEYSHGFMPAENLTGGAIYNISYHCKICVPVENTIIIGLVKVINQELVVSINGPIMIFIPKSNVDSNIWDITEGYIYKKEKGRRLVSGDYVKILIENKRINQNDSQIKTIGKLLELATPEEIDTYFGNKLLDNKVEEIKDNEAVVNNFIF